MTPASPRPGGLRLRVTAVLGLRLTRSVFRIGQVTGLVYDHALHRVTHLRITLAGGEGSLAVPLSSVDFQAVNRDELRLRIWPRAPQAPGDGLPLDGLMVKADEGDGVAFVHDAWFEPGSGDITSYELGALPRRASRTGTVSVPAQVLECRDGHLFAPRLLIARLTAVLAGGLGVPALP